MSSTMPEISAEQTQTEHACPLCGSLAQEVLRSNGQKSLKKCRSCRVFYIVPAPTLKESMAYFSEGFVISPFLNREAVAERVAHSIQKCLKAGRILDVGCGEGHFLSRFFQAGGWETWGVELSKSAATLAANQGINVYTGDTHSAHFPSAFFDVVTVLDAFYYFHDPLGELKEFKRILKPGGLLVVELPQAGPRLWRLTTPLGRFLSAGKESLFDTNDHLFFYEPESLSRILNEGGFRAVRILPLRGNCQKNAMKDFLYRLYGIMSKTLWKLSGARLILGPRLLVLARSE